MYIFDLSYLENTTEAFHINGGNCSLSVQSINGKTIVKSSGGRLQKKVETEGGITTTTYSVGGCHTQITSGKSVKINSQKTKKILNKIFASFNDW